MKIAVTDANIFIDLIEIELLQFLFDLGMEIHTTRAVYDQLNEDQKIIVEPFFHGEMLFIYNLSADDLRETYTIEFPPGLDPVDKSVYFYAAKIGALILTGDKKLRTFCERRSIDVKGIIWVFDFFVEKGVIHKSVAAEKLELLLSINDRLPFEECKRRITKWNSI
jgi:hypothetical protein